MKSHFDRLAQSIQAHVPNALNVSGRGLAIGLAGTIGLLGAIAGNLSVQQVASAQSIITNVMTTSVDVPDQVFTTKTASPCDPKVGTCGTASKTSFGTGLLNNLNIDSVTTSLGTYSFRQLSNRVIINRLNNTISGNRQIIFFQAIPPITQATATVTGDFKMTSGAVSTMEATLLNQSINRGSDNVFANTVSGSAQNYNNVERIDYIIDNGITPTTNAELDDIGFVVMDRGASDKYKIASISKLVSGMPDVFGSPKIFNITNSTLINGITNSSFYVVMRLEAVDPAIPDNLRPTDTTTQPIGGHFVSLRDLGTKVGETVYGYSLLSEKDGPTTAADMNDWSKYPTNTDLGATGGFDVVAGGGIFSKNPLPNNSNYTLSGTVFNDGSGNKLQEIAEPIVNGTTLALNAVLVNSSNQVVATTTVSSTGTYSFSNVAAGTYTVLITTNTPVGTTPPAIALPSNWVTTGENLNAIVDAMADSQQTITVTTANITKIDFGIEQLPTAIGTTATSQPNPTGTNSVSVPVNLFNTSTDPDSGTVDKYRITTFPTNATSITITQASVTTTYTSANFPAAGLTILKAELSTLTVDPNVDGAISVTIPFKAIDNAGKESANTANAIVPFTAPTYGISGTVFNDVSGNQIKNGSEPFVDGTVLSTLRAVLLDSNAQVVKTVIVTATGTYDFGKVIPGNYTIVLTTTAATLANPIVLPTGWVTTGENISGTVDAAPDSSIAVSIVASDSTANNFGIEQLPTPVGGTASSQSNPGTNVSVNVPTNLFTTSSDPDNGTVDKYRITSFPTNATSITVTQGGVTTTYTSTNFPATGLTILTSELSTLKVDPNGAGAVAVTIPFKAIDNAGQESTTTANAIVPFGTSLASVSGSVFDDGNGNKLKETNELFVNVSTLGLKVFLEGIDNAGNLVSRVTTPLPDGSYSFNGVAPGNYTVTVSTNSAGTVVLPTNWVTTGENLGGIVENTPDSKQSITVGSTAIAGVNFGIEQLPTAIGATATPQPNPRNAVSVDVPPALFNSSDLDGTVDQYRITSFPSNATSITIDGVVYTPVAGPGTTAFPAGGVTIPAAKLNTIKVDPNVDGVVDVTIPFRAIDNAGKESATTANAIVPFTSGNKPELILLKRITKINDTTNGKTLNGTPIDLTQVVAQPDNAATPRNESGDASHPGWPTANYPQGAIDAGAIKSGDKIEYTIYFLSAGTDPVRNANFCDWVPKNTTFVPDAYDFGRGIQFAIGSIITNFSNVPDGDRGVFYNPGAIPPATYPDNTTYKLNCMTPMGVDGAVVVNLVNNSLAAPENQLPNTTAAGTPGNSYGFVRFVSKVK